MLARTTLTIGIALLGLFFGGTRAVSFVPVFFIFCLAFVLMLSANCGFRHNLYRLYNFAPFWIGAALALYIVVQILNPWLAFTHMDGFSSPEFLDYMEFLPSSVQSADSSVDSPYASLVAVLLAWLCACSLHLGIISRGDCKYYAKVLFFTSVVLAVCAMGDAIFSKGSVYIWGLMDESAGSHYGSFIYKNQCGAFLLLGMACGIALLMSSMFSRASLAKSFFYGVGVATVAAGVFISRSVGSILFCVLILAASVLVVAWHSRFGKFKISAAIVVVLAAVSVSIFFIYLGQSQVEISFARLSSFIGQDASLDRKIKDLTGDRGKYKEIALDFIATGGGWESPGLGKSSKSRTILGSGATSFGKIMRLRGATDNYFSAKVYSTSLAPNAAIMVPVHAHCDILEAVFEFGLVWLLVFFAMSAYFIRRMVRAKFWKSPFLSILCVGVLSLLAYSFNDIIFYNMFLFAAFCGLATISFDYAEFLYSDNKKVASSSANRIYGFGRGKRKRLLVPDKSIN